MRPSHVHEREADARSIHGMPDPLAPDNAHDGLVTLSLRQLARVVLVAAEAGARFAREETDDDPVAWMFAPRQLFGGARPADAVVDLHNCERAIILHALGLFDGDPEFIDELRVAPHEGCGDRSRSTLRARRKAA